MGKAVAGDNGDLKGAVHEVPAVFGAPALNTQVNDASQGSLTMGTSAVVTHTLGEPIVNEHTAVVPTLAYYGKRSADAEAEADPYLLYGGYYGHAYGPATPTLTATTATTARGPLMPSPRLMLIPPSCMVDTTAMPTATDILMLMEDTTTASKL